MIDMNLILTLIANLLNKNLFWLCLAAFLGGMSFGGMGAWLIQDVRLEALETKYHDFVTAVKENAENQKKKNDLTKAQDQRRQQDADNGYQTNIAILHADIKRLQDARDGRSFLPAAPAGSKNINRACFNRAEFERAIQQLTVGVQGVVTKGDDAVVGLNTGKRWAQSH
jgi:hypothetical protein